MKEHYEKTSLDILNFLTKTASNVLILFLDSASMFLVFMKKNLIFSIKSLKEAGTYMKYGMGFTYAYDLPKRV